MFSPRIASVCATDTSAQPSLRIRAFGAMMIASVALAILSSTSVHAQTCPKGNAGDFLRKLAGDWIGTCEQSTDGDKAEDKYFHVVIKEVDHNTFESHFEYYRLNAKGGTPIPAGSSTVITTVAPDGSANSKISGKGTVMVYQKPKTQEHQLSEVISATGASGVQGEGNGTIKVFGMPLGLGKNGRVMNAKSAWSLDNGVFTVHQTLKVGFKALFINKSFKIAAHYTAKRGTDVATLINNKSRVSSASSAMFQ